MKKRKTKNALVAIIEFLPLYMVLQLFRILSLKHAYNLSQFCFKVAFHVYAKSRNRTVDHLLHAGIVTDRAQARAMARKVYGSFSHLLVEIAKNDQLFDPEKVHEICPATGNEESCELAFGDQKDSPVIILTAHYGNWELAGPACALKSRSPLVSVMRPFENPLIGKYIVGHREGYNHSCCDKAGGIKEMLKAIKSGCDVAILADQHANHKEGVETVFFGHPARTHASPALLHLKTGAPILPVVTRRLDDDFHFAHVFKTPIRYHATGDKEKDIKAVAQMYTSALEELIRECPEQWLWTHRRWLDINRKPRKNRRGKTNESAQYQ